MVKNMSTQTSPKANIREVLFNHCEFADCVLQDVSWQQFGTVIELVLNYLYPDCEGFYLDSNGHPGIRERRHRANLNEPLLKTVRLSSIQEFHVHNRLNDIQIGDLDTIDWGFSEVEVIRIEDNNLFLASYRNRSIPFHHIAIHFSGDRRIDVVFGNIQVL